VSLGQGGGSAAGAAPADVSDDPFAYPLPPSSAQPAGPAQPWAQPARPATPTGSGAPTMYGAPITYGSPPGYSGAGHVSPPPYWPMHPSGTWGPPPTPPGRGRARLVALVGVVVLAAVATAVVGVSRSHAQATSVGSPADDAALSASRRTILAELPRLQAFVAKDRGLAWKKSVNPEVLGDKDFVAALDSGGGSSPTSEGDPDDIGTTFAAMGLAKDANSFYDDSGGATDSDVVGFYDDQTERLVVRGTAWTPSMEYTLVHELTHALQDQNFDLGRLDASARTDDETILTVRALIEGDAERVADDYYDTQSTSWQDAVDGDQGSAQQSATPIVDIYGAMPYVFGEDFVSGLFDKGGNAAVDAAFHAPPSTSQQLLHPEQWLSGRVPTPVPPSRPATPPGHLADVGSLGELGLWAAVDVDDPHASDTKALDGWMGDSYVSSDGGKGACFVDVVHFRSTDGRSTALTLLRRWTDAKHVDVQTQGSQDLRLSACKK
jgi:hypothetical protein